MNWTDGDTEKHQQETPAGCWQTSVVMFCLVLLLLLPVLTAVGQASYTIYVPEVVQSGADPDPTVGAPGWTPTQPPTVLPSPPATTTPAPT